MDGQRGAALISDFDTPEVTTLAPVFEGSQGRAQFRPVPDPRINVTRLGLVDLCVTKPNRVQQDHGAIFSLIP